MRAGDKVYICGANDQTGLNGTNFNGEYTGEIYFSSGGGTQANPITVAEDSAYPNPWLVPEAKLTRWSHYSGNVYRRDIGSGWINKGVFWDYIAMKNQASIGAVDRPGEYHYDGRQYLYVYGYGDAFNNNNGVPGYSNTDYNPNNHDVRRYRAACIRTDADVNDITFDGINGGWNGADGAIVRVNYNGSEGVNRIHVKNGTFVGSTKSRYGLWFEFANNCEITGNEVAYLGAWTWDHGSADGIYIHYGDNNLVENNYVHHIEHANIAVRGKYGASNYTDNNIVRGNYVSYGQSGMITILNGARYTIAEYNYCFYTLPTPTQGNAAVPAFEIGHYSGSAEGPTEDVTIRYNVIDTCLMGIMVGFGGTALPNYMEKVYIYNNLFYNVGRSADDWDGEWWYQGNVDFASHYGVEWEEGDDVIGPSFYIYGNIFHDCGDNGRAISLANDNSGDFAGLDYNVYYSPHGTDNYWYYKGKIQTWTIMNNNYGFCENALIDHNPAFRNALNKDFRLKPGDSAIDLIAIHPISPWDLNPGTYPSDLIWPIYYDELEGMKTIQGPGFDAGPCEYVQDNPDVDPPAPPGGIRIE